MVKILQPAAVTKLMYILGLTNNDSEIRAQLNKNLERSYLLKVRWPSGLRRTLGKRVNGNRFGVRIPSSPHFYLI